MAGGTSRVQGRGGGRAWALGVSALALLAAILASPGTSRAASGWELILDRPTPHFAGIDFVSPDEGWLTAGAGLLRTNDGGATWTEAAQLSGNDVDFSDAEHGWLVGPSGSIYGTADGGETWTRQESGTQVHLSEVVAVGQQEAWAVGSREGYSDVISYLDPTALLHTTDGGATWQSVVTPPDAWFEEIEFVGDAGWVLGERCLPPPDPYPCAAGATRTLLRTTDGGGTWDLVDAGLPAYTRNLVFVDQQNGWLSASACVSGDPNQCLSNLYHTQDGGLTWQAIDMRPFGLVGAFTFRDPLTGWAIMRECQVIVCALSLAATTDGGASWTTTPIADTRGHVTSLLATESALYAVGSGIALRSIDGGGVWETMKHPAITFDDAAFVSDLTGYALSEGDILRSDDSGRSWVRLGAAPGATRSIEFPSEDVGFAAGGDCAGDGSGCTFTVYRSGDGGETWAAIQSRGSPFLPYAELRFRSINLGWYSFDDTLVLTANGGATWQERPIGGEGDLQRIELTDGSHAWAIRTIPAPGAGGDDYQVWRSSDGGLTWGPASERQRGYVQHLQFVDAQHGWYVKTLCDNRCQDSLVMTADGGETWEETALAQGAAYDLLLADAVSGWLSVQICEIGCSGAIWHTSDGGHSWQSQSEGAHLWGALSAVDPETAWLASGHPMGIGGAPPSRTYLYHVAGVEEEPSATAEPAALPVTGRDAPAGSSGGGSVAIVAAFEVCGALALGAFMALRRVRG